MAISHREIESISSTPLIGSIDEFFSSPLKLYERCAEIDEPIVRTHAFQKPFFVIQDPLLVEEVLDTKQASFGRGYLFGMTFGEFAPKSIVARESDDHWRTQRLTGQQVFRPQVLDDWIPVFHSVVTDFTEQFDEPQDVAFHEEAQWLIFSLAVETLFGRSAFPQHSKADLLVAVEKMLDRFRSPVNAVLPSWAPTSTNRRYREGLETIQSVAEACLLSDDTRSPSLPAHLRSEFDIDDPDVRSRVVDDLITYLIAGLDTAGGAVSYGCHLLSEYPEIQERVAAEAALLSDPEEFSIRDIQTLEYTQKFIKEVLRIYPPAPHLPRGCTEDVVIGEYAIPEGAAVVLPQWTLHRSSEYFDDPLTPLPERWDGTPTEFEYAYFPFGGGKRHCMGRRYAITVLSLIFPLLAANLDFKRALADLEISATITAYPKHGVPLRLGPSS